MSGTCHSIIHFDVLARLHAEPDLRGDIRIMGNTAFDNEGNFLVNLMSDQLPYGRNGIRALVIEDGKPARLEAQMCFFGYALWRIMNPPSPDPDRWVQCPWVPCGRGMAFDRSLPPWGIEVNWTKKEEPTTNVVSFHQGANP